MVDLSDRPPVPDWDPEGDERYGLLAAGVVLLVLGGGIGIVLNVVLHQTAPPSGWVLPGPVHVGPRWGALGYLAIALGAIAVLLGAVLVWLSRQTPKGRFVLPGAPY